MDLSQHLSELSLLGSLLFRDSWKPVTTLEETLIIQCGCVCICRQLSPWSSDFNHSSHPSDIRMKKPSWGSRTSPFKFFYWEPPTRHYGIETKGCSVPCLNLWPTKPISIIDLSLSFGVVCFIEIDMRIRTTFQINVY